MPHKDISEVMDAHTLQWMSLEGVVGVAQGECEGEPCIRVLLVDHAAQRALNIPEQVDGYRVELQVIGNVRAR